ncbi:unnamed protein product, partial [Mesorhabditis belari]|uniref:Annexin n=1 Tax=Mesorhabditis belari TaxID=2138241 RepID=A0AAF3EB05_9BILA
MAEGTIHPSATFDEERYVHEIHKALTAKQINHDAVIDYLVKISNAQRQMLRTPYKYHYQKDLEETLVKELKGDLENVIISLLQTPAKADAIALQKAVKGLGTDERALIELLTTRSNEEIEAARNTFYTTYNRTLEDAITADTSGDFRLFLLQLCRGARDQTTQIDSFAAKHIANELNTGVEKKEKFEKLKFLVETNPHQLQLIFSEYEKISGGKTFEKFLEKDFSSDAKDLVLALAQVARNKPLFFAQQINHAVKGFGAKHADLIRILVSRSEIDLDAIKVEYEKAFGKTLLDTIKSEAKGDYKNALVALVFGNRKN